MMNKVCRLRYIFLFLCFFFTIFFISSFSVHGKAYQIVPGTIQKSENDKRQYQVIVLSNQMRVLLVSDASAIKSLGAIGVHVGSLQDPIEQQGLAHYTEHMVLMGSKNYPESDGFAEFLSKHAGKYNASTAFSHTIFYFEVENTALPEALCRLADAVAFPLLNKDYAEKERNAVNQEATLARSNDGFRLQQVESETINQAHPAALFSVGNLETLSDKKYGALHDALTLFHHYYYSANLMVGIVYGKDELSTLAKLAEDSFGHIENKNVTVHPVDVPAMTDKELGKMIYLEPAQPKRVLYLQFPIENKAADFENKSGAFIGYLINNRSEGSLVDVLMKRGLIDSIDTTYEPSRYGNSGIFSVVVSLTEEGLLQKDSIIAAIFSYLDLMKSKGIKETYYNEMKNLLSLDFKYQSVSRDMGYVEWLTEQLFLYPTPYILKADYVIGAFDKQQINKTLAKLNPNNMRIWVIAPNQYYDKEAYFMQAPYRIASFSSEQKQRWKWQDAPWHFSLPAPNPFITTDLSLIDQDNDKPISYKFSPRGNLLHFPSYYFANEPKAAVILSLRNNHVFDTIKDQILFPIMDYLVARSMANLSFQAEIAGITLDRNADNGLMLSAIGYSQHLPNLIDALFKTYRELQINDNDLKLAKSWYLQQLNAANSVSSYALAMQPIHALNTIPYTERDARLQAVDSITTHDVIQYRDRLINESVPYLFVLGNIDKNNASALFKKIKSQLSNKAVFVPPEMLSISQSRKALIRQTSANTDHALGLIYLPKDNKSQAASIMLSKIMSPWFYKQLRSEEQLAYAIFNFPINVGESFGFGFLIQSNKYDPAYLYQRYQALFPKLFTKLNAITDQTFKQYKTAILSEVREPPHTLSEEVNFYLDDFMRSNFAFDSNRKLVFSLERISKRELVKFYKNMLFDNEGLTLISEVVGSQTKHDATIPKGYILYSNASSLQKALLKMERND